MGLILLFFSKRLRESVLILAWLFSSFLLTQLQFFGIVIDYNRFLYMMIIPLMILASVSFVNMRNCVKVSKGTSEDQAYDVEIQVEKAIPALFTLVLLLLTPLQGIATNQAAYNYYMPQTGYSSEGRLEALDWIRQNTGETATIVTNFNFGRWVEGYGERRALFPIPPEAIFMQSEFTRYLVADTIIGSNYQLANKYLKIDEWQPVSTEFSPLVSVFQGQSYEGLVYMSDSFNKINLTRDGKTWIEAPCNAWLYESRWLERNDNEAHLQISFETMGLNIIKKLDLLAEQTYANVTYNVTPKPNVTLDTACLNVFLAWGRSLYSYEVIGNEATLYTDVGVVKVRFQGELLKVEVGKDPEYHQDRVYAEFKANPEGINMGVEFEVLAPQSSWIEGVWASSAGELEHNYNVTYIAVPVNSYDVDRFSFNLPEGPVMCVDDCFARVNFTKAGGQWIEAAYAANVSGEQGETTSYETIGLYINKTIVQNGPRVDFTYDVKGKQGVALQELELTVWMCWERQISDVKVEDGKAVLVTDAGALEIEASGKVLNVTYGPDEEYHQPRILVTYELNPDQDSASLAFICLNDRSTLSVQLKKTTRPVMEGSDRAIINVTAPHYREVFRNNEIVIYETPSN